LVSSGEAGGRQDEMKAEGRGKSPRLRGVGGESYSGFLLLKGGFRESFVLIKYAFLGGDRGVKPLSIGDTNGYGAP